MKIGFIGLGKMGSQMVKRLTDNGHQVSAFDVNLEAVKKAQQNGAKGMSSRQKLVDSLDKTIIWIMIPSQFVDKELETLLEIIPRGSILIDGGNSDYRDTQKRSELATKKGISWIDVGTSGGIMGLKQGFSMMIGGDTDAVEQTKPLYEALSAKNGWHYFGPSGSGHYVKMVHNGIEYGLMESYAEGYRMLKDGPYSNIDLVATGEVWRHGSIISSLLNDLAVEVLQENPTLKGIDGYVAESGEARWTLETAKELDINLPAIQASFKVRLDSQRGKINFGTKLLAAMRNKFGGHAINKESK